jgi:hypothetical protein
MASVDVMVTILSYVIHAGSILYHTFTHIFQYYSLHAIENFVKETEMTCPAMEI